MPQVNGEIHHIGTNQKITDNFTKREMILVTEKNTNFPQYVPIYFANQKADLLNNFKVGQQVSVDFNIQGRLDKKDETKAFLQLQGWKIEKV